MGKMANIEIIENKYLEIGFAGEIYVTSANGNLIPTSTSFHKIS